MCSSLKTQWQAGFPTQVLLWDQRTEVCSIASLSLILTLKQHIASFHLAVVSCTSSQNFLKSRENYFLKSTSKLSFHWLLRVCLCTFSLSPAVFAVQAILVGVEGDEQADGFSSCKSQDQLSGKLSEVGSWQPHGYNSCSPRNSTVSPTGEPTRR